MIAPAISTELEARALLCLGAHELGHGVTSLTHDATGYVATIHSAQMDHVARDADAFDAVRHVLLIARADG